MLLPYEGIYRHTIQNIPRQTATTRLQTPGNPRLFTGIQHLFTGGNDRPAHNPGQSNTTYIPGQLLMRGGLAPISCLAETPKRDNRTRQPRPKHTNTSTILKMIATWVALQILRHMTPTFPYWGEGLTLLWHATRGHTKMGQTSSKGTARSTPKRHSMIILRDSTRLSPAGHGSGYSWQ